MNTGEILVNIVTASDEAYARGIDDFNVSEINERADKIPHEAADTMPEEINASAACQETSTQFDSEAYADLMRSLDLENDLVGVLRTNCDTLADAVIPDSTEIIWGRDYYMEELLGLKFRVSAFSFFQTNVEAVTRLYSEALALIPQIEGKKVFDLFCGTGTISQIMALKADKVLGVEIVEEAVEAARENAELNGLNNCQFLAGDVYKVLEGNNFEKPDVIVVDPPRSGIQPKALDKIISYGVEEILYVSCNPKTMAQNLAYFEDCGYKTKYLKPFDNFPFTKHTECIVLLHKEEISGE